MNRRYFLKIISSFALALPFIGLPLPKLKEKKPTEFDMTLGAFNTQCDGYIQELKELMIQGTTSFDGRCIVLTTDHGNIMIERLIG